MPFGVVCVLVSWLFLLVVVRPDDIQSIPVVFYERGGALGKRNIAVIVLTLSVIALFVCFSFFADVFGDIGIISLCFVTIMFGSGLLSEVTSLTNYTFPTAIDRSMINDSSPCKGRLQ